MRMNVEQTSHVAYDNESHDEYTALKSKLVSITDSLLTALDDCDDTGFTTVSRNKHATWCYV